MIDVATLTGAIGVALGQHYSGAFTNSDDLWNEINKAGNETWVIRLFFIMADFCFLGKILENAVGK